MIHRYVGIPRIGKPIRGNGECECWMSVRTSHIAYAKVFFKKSGYITKEWYPYFLAARRGNQLFEEEYAYGTISNAAKRIYEAIEEYGTLPVHGIKVIAGFSKEDKSLFDRAMIKYVDSTFIKYHSTGIPKEIREDWGI